MVVIAVLFIPIYIVITIGIIITVFVIIVIATIILTISSFPLRECLTYSSFFFLFRAGRYVTNSPASLAYRDVFVLTDDDNLQDEVRYDAGHVTSPATGVVRALRHSQMPVCVLERRDRAGVVAEWESRVADVAVARTDEVTVAHWESVQGLERRVVVWLSDLTQDDIPRLHALSRCTTQLIIVDTPP